MAEYPNWFEFVRPNFEEFLTPLAGQPLHCLQLGAYTGDASVWLCENILTHRDSKLQDVDTWQGSNELGHKDINFDEVFKIHFDRTKDLPVQRFRKTTVDYLCTAQKYYSFDFIYIDADHTTVGVLLDAELSWPMLKSGGIMAFDDYTWQHHTGDPRLAPQVGIDLFLHRHELDYQLLTKNHQVWIKKR